MTRLTGSSAQIVRPASKPSVWSRSKPTSRGAKNPLTLPTVSIVATATVARSGVMPGSSIGIVSAEGKYSQVEMPNSARLGNSTSGASEMKLPIGTSLDDRLL